MNLPDFVTDPVNSVHIIRDAHTAPLLLDHTADYIPMRHMCLPHVSSQHSFGLLWTWVYGKCSIGSCPRRLKIGARNFVELG